jgi:hypothetical protein
MVVSVCDGEGSDASVDHPPPRVFSEKRLQVAENKEREVEKEGKEAANA